MTSRITINIEVWMKGLMAAAISGAANGVITGFAAVGIDPLRFNLQSGMKPTLALAGVSALMSSLIGTSAYLKQSPLPPEDLPADFDSGVLRRDANSQRDQHWRDTDGRADDRRDAAPRVEQRSDRDHDGDGHHDGHPADRPR